MNACVVIFVLIVHGLISALIGKADEYVERKSYEDLLIKSAGCQDGGRLLSINSCIDKDYRRYDAPEEVVTLYNTFIKEEVIEVNEGHNTIKLDIEMEQSWEDSRIRLNMADLEPKQGYVRLPWDKVLDPKQQPIIWNPWFHDVSILDMSSIKSHYGSIENSLTSLGLVYKNVLHQNLTGVRLTMDFIVTITCHFEYDGYPLDTEKCKFRLNNSPYKPMKLKLLDPEKKYHSEKKTRQAFGFDVTISFMNGNQVNDDNSSAKNNKVLTNISKMIKKWGNPVCNNVMFHNDCPNFLAIFEMLVRTLLFSGDVVSIHNRLLLF